MSRIIKLLIATAFLSPSLLVAAEWSIPKDFDSIGEPGSSWSAGRSDLMAAESFTPFTEVRENESMRMWSFSEQPAPDWGNGLVWLATRPDYGIELGQVAIHPGNSFEKATCVRWTAPAGTPQTTYHVRGLLSSPRSGDRDFIIRVGDESLMEKRAITQDQEFDFDFTASGGQSLDFVVGCGDSWTDEAAGFSVTITQGSSAPQ